MTKATTYELTLTEYLPGNIAAVHYVCRPVATLGRDLEAGDMVDASRRDWGFIGVLRQTKRGFVVQPDGVAGCLRLQDVEIHGLVTQVQQVFRA
jgi:hypothetical protein